jgi:hypothetical protein
MLYNSLKSKGAINGYKYSYGSGGKKWVRGRTMYSEGRQWMSNNEWIMVITKTNLDTHEITLASLKEAKRFLTEDGYKEYIPQFKIVEKEQEHRNHERV